MLGPIFLSFSLILELLEGSRKPRDLRGHLFSKCAFYHGGSTIFETCTSNNGNRVTEGAYALAWDEERPGEGGRTDEARIQRTK